MTQIPAIAARPRVRVMIVDDSAVMRSVINRTLAGQDDIEVVGTAQNGEAALRSIKTLDPDIVVLDIEMPVMDGITALPLLMKEKPGVRVLICSTLSARGADISVRALSLGASDCVLKPGGDVTITPQEFQESLLKTVRNLSFGLKRNIIPNAATPAAKTSFSLRKPTGFLPPQIIAIGSSTGGPKILMEVITGLKNLPVPIVITQHMPKTFTAMLAQHITTSCGVPCEEGSEGAMLRPGHAYIAPGGYHMMLRKSAAGTSIHIDDGPPENFCKPSVNPMLRSLIPVYGGRILSVILTGMGADGSQACADITGQGGEVIAQDEATSTVWGMPGAVAVAGLCSAVLPADQISDWIKRSIKGGRS